MDVFRCPTCLGMLADPTAQRCPICNQRLNRRAPVVLAARGMPVEVASPIRKVGRRRRSRHFGARGDAK